MSDQLPPVDVSSMRPAEVIATSRDGATQRVLRVPLRDVFEDFMADDPDPVVE